MCQDKTKDDKYEQYDSEIKFRYFNDRVPSAFRVDHQHPKFEVYFSPTAVPGSLNVNSKHVSWEKPCVLIIYPYMLHSPIRTTEKRSDYDRYYFSFSEHMFKGFDERFVDKIFKQQNSCCLYLLDEKKASELCRIIASTAERRDTASRQEKELVFMAFMTRLTELCGSENVQCFDTMSSYILDVMKYIRSNFTKTITSENIASDFSVSRSKLERNFRAETGYSVHNFIDICRMNEAMRLLDSPEYKNVKRVAEACGFENETYFYLFFKKHAEMSPLEYRRKKTEKNKT